MDWTLHADGEIDGQIQRLEDDVAVQMLASEDFALIEMRAHDVADKAHVDGEACRARAAFDVEEISRLRAERV